jgi:hypothetical protein
MARYDIESFLTDLVTFLKANLNTKLAAIDTEKNDGITLKQINTTYAYMFQSMNDKIANYDPVLLYGIEDIKSEGIGPATAKTYPISIVIIVADPGTDSNMMKRILRYSRALSELLEGSWSQIGNAVKVTVSSLAPISFKLQDRSDDFRAVGVQLEVTII